MGAKRDYKSNLHACIKREIHQSEVQWNSSNQVTIGTTAACPEYRDVHSLEASSIFSAGVAMCTCDVECVPEFSLAVR